MYMDSRLVHFSKAWSPIVVTDDGMNIFFKPVHARNELRSISFIVEGIVSDSIYSAPMNAGLDIDVTGYFTFLYMMVSGMIISAG